MRIDDLLNDMNTKQQIPDSLPAVYELEDEPDSEMNRELQQLYEE